MSSREDIFFQFYRFFIVSLYENANAVIVSSAILSLVSLATFAMTKPSSSVPKKQRRSSTPRPKWRVFQILNYVMLTIFVWSVTYVAVNYKHSINLPNNEANPLKNMFFPLMILWTMCLAYFFGFFGISFLDTESLVPDHGSVSSPTAAGSSSSSSFSSSSSQSDNDEDGVGEEDELDECENEPESEGNINKQEQPLSAPVLNSLELNHVVGKKDAVEKGIETSKSGCNDVNGSVEMKVEQTLPSGLLTEQEDENIVHWLETGQLKDHQLEARLPMDPGRAVYLRRLYYQRCLLPSLSSGDDGITSNNLNDPVASFQRIPYEHFDYTSVVGSNCERVVGYVPVPVGLVGPLWVNGESYYLPLATTEGCLLASTNRGCKALSIAHHTAGGPRGCQAVVLKDAMTRAPCLRCPSALKAAAVKSWCEIPETVDLFQACLSTTSRFLVLESLEAWVCGRDLYLRFGCQCGDAMGMNMISQGVSRCITEVVQRKFPDVEIVALSGNLCTDKKPSAVNWVLGRGKSVVAEAVLSPEVVSQVLKTSVPRLVDVHRRKNLVGSALAGVLGGYNAHAANIVAALYLATGQDLAQVVESSACLTTLEVADDGESLYAAVTMPCIEVGTVGGGTGLPAQAACLGMLGVRGPTPTPSATNMMMDGENATVPGDHARKLAQIVAAAVLAGELSLMAALAEDQLVKSHMKHNRKKVVCSSSSTNSSSSSSSSMSSAPIIVENSIGMEPNSGSSCSSSSCSSGSSSCSKNITASNIPGRCLI